jgi:cell division cycle 20-like protein 1 (cofactor of APC complex)
LLHHSNLDDVDAASTKHKTDRFIPIRKCSSNISDKLICSQKPDDKENVRGKELKESKLSVEEMFRNVVLSNPSDKLLSFQSHEVNQPFRTSFDCSKFGLNYEFKKKPSAFRKIPKTPFKVLDAPNLQDDFYLNLVDWSSQNVLSVALGSCVYMWDANNNKVSKFCDLAPTASVSSLNWNPKGTQISIGTSLGDVQVWDLGKNKKLLNLQGHLARVSSLAWSSSILASGSRDKTILYRDIRENPNCVINRITAHTQEVCGLKWSKDEQSLASGGNDNKLYVWNTRSSIPISKFSNHTAAVKALAWNPNLHGLLASGGGSADRTIRFWNTLTNTEADWIDTGSQVCNLLFSTNTNELVSTHGYSQNEIVVWKYPSLEKVTTLTGHSSRVLYLAMNPKG